MFARMFKTMAFTLAGLVVTFFGVGHLLADRWQVETRRSIAAKPERIAELLGDFDAWERWSTMKIALGPQVQRTVTGTPGTAGHAVAWSGAQGKSTLALVRFGPGELGYDYHSQRSTDAAPTLAGRGSITWTAEGDQVLVVWRDDAPLDSLAARWVGWFGGLQERVKQIHTTSLQGLAAAAESSPAAPVGTPGTPEPAKTGASK